MSRTTIQHEWGNGGGFCYRKLATRSQEKREKECMDVKMDENPNMERVCKVHDANIFVRLMSACDCLWAIWLLVMELQEKKKY